MANAVQLKRRIKTAQNVSKTTKAMQMIAASKLKKAQSATLASRPYVQEIQTLVKRLTQHIAQDKKHPLMQQKSDTGKTLYIVISPDKGLCGALVTNLKREYLRLSKESALMITVGKKLEQFAAHLQSEVIATYHMGSTLPRFSFVYDIAPIIEDYFLQGKVDKVAILTTNFQSIFTQKTEITQLLPITEFTTEENQKTFSADTITYEPSVDAMLPALLKRYLEMVLYQHLLEGYLSEQGARMISMQNATNNAKDMIRELTLQYNKARQEKITSEILDISSGAGAAAYA